jgi:hypothetical protein
MKIQTWWNQQERDENPEPREYNMVLVNNGGNMRPVEEADLYAAGFTSQETAMEAAKELSAKHKKRLTTVKNGLIEATEIIRTIVQQYKECVSSGYTFEEFDNPAGLEEAIESAEAFLDEVE